MNTQIATECEASHCSEAKGLKLYMTMWLCPKHLQEEVELQAKSKAEADKRVAESRSVTHQNAVIAKAQEIDSRIELKEDIFNARTIEIMELDKAVQNDETIPPDQKPLFLAEELHRRYTRLAQIVHDARAMLIDAGNQQRAIQTYMNTLSNKLRSEERERLKLSDISYTPDSVKAPKVPKGPAKQPKKQASANEVKAIAGKYNIPIELLKMRLVRVSDETPEQAAQAIAKKLGLS